MSLKPQPIPEIPAETVRVVRAVYPKGNIYIYLHDMLGTIYQDELFADLYPERGQPAYAPWRLALVTVLSEFRTRLVALAAEERFLDAVLALCKEQGWLRARGRQRTDSTHILAKIRALNRAECVVETLRYALNVLSVVAPDWSRGRVQPDWLERYGPRASEYRFPSGEDKRQQFLHQVGQDGWGLLSAIMADSQSHWMLSIPAIDTLQRIWKQDYLPLDAGGSWIAEEDRLEAARLFYSPYDLDAEDSKKRSTYWIGYKVHFNETCDEDGPHLITHVATDIGPIPDREALPAIHTALDRQDLLPQQHRVDAGYVDAELLVASQMEYGVDLVGSTGKDHRWQTREQTGYASRDFSLDWEHEQARCPQGHSSSSWTPTKTRGQEVIKIKFAYTTCGACPVRSQCTQAKRRTVNVRRREASEALEAAREREKTKEFAQLYAGRAGIEGTHAQGVRRMGLRRSRYVGEPRTHLQHVATATAMNLCRLHDWLTGVSPPATPLSHFERFMKQAA